MSAFVMMTAFAATPVWAQDVGELNSPAVPGWMTMVVGIVLAAGMFTISYMSSKRGHQD